MTNLAQIIERLRRAEHALREAAEARAVHNQTEEVERLRGKIEGVRLARSYLQESAQTTAQGGTEDLLEVPDGK